MDCIIKSLAVHTQVCARTHRSLMVSLGKSDNNEKLFKLKSNKSPREETRLLGS